MKKIVILCVTAATLLAMLTGCTSPMDDAGTTGQTQPPSTSTRPTTEPTTKPTTEPTTEPSSKPTSDPTGESSKETTKS